MGHTEIAPETAAHSQRKSDANYELKIGRRGRDIKLLSCTLLLIAALCVAIIRELLWYIIREVPCQDQVVTQNEFNAEAEQAKIEKATNMAAAKILEAQGEMIRSLQFDLDEEKQETNKRFEAFGTKLDAQKAAVKVVSETRSADITQFQMAVKNQGEIITDLQTKLHGYKTEVDVLESAVKTYGEMLQNVSETTTKMHMDDFRKLKDGAIKRSKDISLLNTQSENSSIDINILKTDVKNQQETIKDFDTQLGTQEAALKTYGDLLQNVSKLVTELHVHDLRNLKEENEKHSNAILKLKVLHENHSTDIVSLQREGKNQGATIRGLETKFQELDMALKSQESAVKTNTEMLQNVNETMRRFDVYDVRKLTDDAEKRIEDIMWLKEVSENSSADISSLQTTVKNQEETIRDMDAKFKEPTGTGSTYTRWGRPDCPGSGTELVYSGYVGGGYYYHGGSAVNYLCLTKKPTWNHTTIINNSAYLYGAEYQFGSLNFNKYLGQKLGDHEPPCAVCRSFRVSVVMIPGTNICAEGWTMEYAGYLVAGHHGHPTASEYICLDSSATTAAESSSSNHDGKLLYLVSAQCGSLKCPPYVANREVTCVVCTQ